MRSKLTSVADAVSSIPSGCSLAVGGSLLRRQPMAIVRELMRQGTTDLTLLTWASSMATDILAAHGAVRAWEGIYVGYWWHGLAPGFRRAVEDGRIAVQDRSESVMTARFRAAAMGVPFLPIQPMRGIGSVEGSDLRPVPCPYTGNELLAVPAATPDVTILHGYVGDESGNVAWPAHRDSDDIDLIMAAGARRLIVSVERLVPHEEIARRPNLTYIPHVKVSAICAAPWGAYPTACDTMYDEDAAELRTWLTAGRDPEAARVYLDRWTTHEGDHAELAASSAGHDRLASLTVESAGVSS